ncbi:hypothetical protein Tco_0011772 [Tanacetum coccineum]
MNDSPNVSGSASRASSPLVGPERSTSGTLQADRHLAPSALPSNYKSVGRYEYSCEYCGALFWYEERLKGVGRLLLNDRHFMENIKAYNQMFNMTSLGPERSNSGTLQADRHLAPSTLPSNYKSVGRCEYSCEYCGALFWYEERLKGVGRYRRPNYNCCCKGGRVALRTYQIYPDYIRLLLNDRHFMENIRAYNQMFNMTSLGVHIDKSVNNGRGPYVFKISDQLYHWLGSLSPVEGDPPRFLKLYIYDTDNEVDNCRSHFGGENSHLCRDIFEGFIDMLDTPNALVQLFRTAREKLADTYVPNFKVRLYNVVGVREYEMPTGDMLGAIVYEPGPETDMDYDIIIEERSAITAILCWWAMIYLYSDFKNSLDALAFVVFIEPYLFHHIYM